MGELRGREEMRDSVLGGVFPQGKTHDSFLGLLDREGERERPKQGEWSGGPNTMVGGKPVFLPGKNCARW